MDWPEKDAEPIIDNLERANDMQACYSHKYKQIIHPFDLLFIDTAGREFSHSKCSCLGDSDLFMVDFLCF